jgi:hypothetical protein
MRTKRDGEAHIAAAIQAWAHCMGIEGVDPIRVATERATAEYRHGATVSEACGVARGFVLSWQRHPANAGCWRPTGEAA